MSVTSFDVARLAGVSQATVSRALRDMRGTSEATRRRVREAARQLGYVPRQTARSLATSRTRRIGVVIGELGNPFYAALLDPLIARLHERGYLAVVVHDDDVSELDCEPLLDGSLDGAVLATVRAGSAAPEELGRRGVPFVLVNREQAGKWGDVSVADNRAGATLAAELLLGLGHRRIGMIGGPPDTSTARARTEAFRDALAAAGVALSPGLVVHGAFDLATGSDGFDRLMGAPRPPTAIFCANDVLAIGALHRARSSGVDVPSQVSVVGFDDIPLASLAQIGLTTVSADLRTMAVTAVDLLLERLADPALGQRRVLHAATLVRRATHAAAP
ncbi:LacI family DNA-binding transcriptional regulator [Sphaerisporangium krabiense]|uniref:LacI family transcriptional regulator n=1 Tax=Sphaerisporangium krabiense TaxID=763782 RepID=A0A7W8Z8T8_9ACTN|nr:LacI family DNA-binding transcriptional regulator [Sphaerisporangium krabiense]MBB5629492.1 LacI family transcriptional regulator [Sphaerisporangium krabiense]